MINTTVALKSILDPEVIQPSWSWSPAIFSNTTAQPLLDSDVRARACDKACHKPWKARFCYGHNYNWNQNLVTYIGLETKYDFLGRKKNQNFQLGYFIFVAF